MCSEINILIAVTFPSGQCGTSDYYQGCLVDVLSVKEVGSTEYQQPFEVDDSILEYQIFWKELHSQQRLRTVGSSFWAINVSNTHSYDCY